MVNNRSSFCKRKQKNKKKPRINCKKKLGGGGIIILPHSYTYLRRKKWFTIIFKKKTKKTYIYYFFVYMHLRQSFILPPGFLLIQQFLQIGLLVSHLFLHLYRSLYLHKTTPLVILARPYPTYFLLVLYMFGKLDNQTLELWMPKNSHSFDNKQIVRHAYINKLSKHFCS